MPNGNDQGDKLYAQESRMRIEALERRFDTHKAENEIRWKDHETEEKERWQALNEKLERLASRPSWTVAFILGGLLSIVVGFVVAAYKG